LSSVGWDLLCSTHIPNLKCPWWPATKKWKATPNVKILVFSHPLGNLAVTNRVLLWLDGKRVVDLILAIIAIAILASSHGCGTIKRNLSKSAFSDKSGSLWAQISGGRERRPQSIYGPLERNYVATTLPLKVFTRTNFAADFFRQKLKFIEKIAKSRFVPPFGGLRGNVDGSSVAHWKVRSQFPISANWTFFASSHGWGAMSRYWSKSWCSKGGWVTVSTNFLGKGIVHQQLLASEK